MQKANFQSFVKYGWATQLRSPIRNLHFFGWLSLGIQNFCYSNWMFWKKKKKKGINVEVMLFKSQLSICAKIIKTSESNIPFFGY